MRLNRALIGVGLLLFLFVVLPLSKAILVKTSFTSALRHPIAFSRDLVQILTDLRSFHRNAEELRASKRTLRPAAGTEAFQHQAALLENERLTRLLGLRRILGGTAGRPIYARVIARSPLAWNRLFLVDKGLQQGIRVNMPVVSEASLIGKIIEAGPQVSKALLLTDPNSRIGALIQRTRHQGILYGTPSGECRMKYLSVDAAIQPGDIVESAGYGGFFPKGLVIGTVEKIWKEPGQIYQVASVKPLTDLSRVEEVACLA